MGKTGTRHRVHDMIDLSFLHIGRKGAATRMVDVTGWTMDS